MVFLELRPEPGVYSRVTTGRALPDTCLFSDVGLLPRCEGHLGILLESWHGNWDASPREAGDPGSLSTWHRDTETPIHFQEESGIVSFGSIDLRAPLEFSKNVRPPVSMRRRTRSFSVVSTGDSDNPSSWEMQDEPAFNTLQGYPALPRVRASRCPFHLRPHTQGPSHIPVAERSLPLRCLWKVGIPLESNPGTWLSSRVDLGSTEPFCVATVTSGSL